MSQLNSIPKQSYFSAQLQSPVDSSQTDGIILSKVPDFAFGGNLVFFNIVDGANSETISATGVSGNELTGVTRAIATYDGEAATAYLHGAGITVVLSDDWKYWEAIQTAVNSKADTDSPSFTTDIQVPVYADSAARDVAIPAPANGMIVYNTADGVFQGYQSGSWQDVENGVTPNATEAIAGKVELATVAEQGSTAVTGATGAGLSLQPRYLVKTSSGATDENRIAILDAAGKFADGFLGAAESGASVVVKSKADNKIDDSLLGLTTAGDLVYSDGTDLLRLPIGTAGQLLAVNSGAAAPEWVGLAIDTSPARAINTDYQNTSHRPKLVLVTVTLTTVNSNEVAGGVVQLGATSPPATTIATFLNRYGSSAAGNKSKTQSVTFVVPASFYYSVDNSLDAGGGATAISSWVEYTL